MACFLKQNANIRCPPSDFLELVVRAMLHLQHNACSNVFYLLVKALGTMRPDQSDSLLPVKGMPMGLVEYIVQFFTASSTQQVHNNCGNTVPYLLYYMCSNNLCSFLGDLSIRLSFLAADDVCFVWD